MNIIYYEEQKYVNLKPKVGDRGFAMRCCPMDGGRRAVEPGYRICAGESRSRIHAFHRMLDLFCIYISLWETYLFS